MKRILALFVIWFFMGLYGNAEAQITFKKTQQHASTAYLDSGESAWVLIQSQTASATGTIDFTTGIDSTYDLYRIVLSNFLPATDGALVQVTIFQTTIQEGATAYEYISHHADSAATTITGTNSAGDNFMPVMVVAALSA